MYSFKAKIASCGYHVFKETSWSNTKEGDEVKVELETNKSSNKIDPYACAIRAKEECFKGWKTVGHIPREISRHVYFFYKIRGRFCQRDSNINKIPHVTNTNWWTRDSIVTHVFML